MTDLLARPVVPVVEAEDAATTARALARRLPADAVVTAVHVVEKAGGAPDTAAVEQRERAAADAFDAFREALPDVSVETDVRYGTDVAAAVFDAAADLDATAIAFTPREGGRLVRLLTGDVARSLLDAADRPVVVLPADEDADRPERGAEEP